MPYFIFSITPGPSQIVNDVQMLDKCDDFKAAKKIVRSKRAELSPDSQTIIRIVFAKDGIEAEELLSERREKPILQEWEK